eukprot:TRINITY_DN8674_c0_g1_i1.p2 TRINITY_DN8674_c0_g1~~TRINITY_DN8674_c0_g1_i1.p2  ORF type:complete len:119 (+),score=2.17 TRINITY_DN8674_c0_g1_i1:96-452(+)
MSRVLKIALCSNSKALAKQAKLTTLLEGLEAHCRAKRKQARTRPMKRSWLGSQREYVGERPGCLVITLCVGPVAARTFACSHAAVLRRPLQHARVQSWVPRLAWLPVPDGLFELQSLF